MDEFYQVKSDWGRYTFDTYKEALACYLKEVEFERRYWEQHGEGEGYETFNDYLAAIELKIYKVIDITPH